MGIIRFISTLFFFLCMLTSLIMIFVFSFCPWLVYPNAYTNGQYINTTTTTTSWSFYMRCDIIQNNSVLELLLSCNISEFIITPVCPIPYVSSYWSQAYAYGIISNCSTGYIQELSANITSILSPNLVALSSGMMILSFIIFVFILIIVTCCIP